MKTYIASIVKPNKISHFKNLPKDLEMWINNTNNCQELYAKFGFSLLSDEEIIEIHNRRSKDKAINYALEKVFEKIVFVAKNLENQYFAYSLFDTELLNEAPVVSFSNEYFWFNNGNLTEAMLFTLEEYNKYRDEFLKYGLKLDKMSDIINNGKLIQEKSTQPDDIQSDFEYEYEHGRDISHLKFEINKKEFLEWRIPRLGRENPTKVDSKVWKSSIASKEGAYWINEHFKGLSSFDEGAVWCFDRLGKSITRLKDREIHIAGEHEDHYDPDFYIYNDVVVIYANDSIDTYTYPKDIFPPTDFHTATLIDKNTILLIGNLSYYNNRKVGFTQVLALDIRTFKITKIKTTGDNPGWIFKHDALLSDNKKSINVVGGTIFTDKEGNKENIDEWQLDLETYEWKRNVVSINAGGESLIS